MSARLPLLVSALVLGPVLAPVLVGCARQRDEQRPADDGALFPHPADYQAAAQHGADSIANGPAACARCHDEDPGGPPPCAECHQGYPHAAGWIAGATHGPGTWGKDGDTSSCEPCHDQAGLVATERFGCTTCHSSWPHPEGWAEAGSHGVYALARGSAVAACGACHGADLSGGDLSGGDVAVGCTDCHDSWPHVDGWAEGAVHGVADSSSCAGCHGDDGDGGTSGVACDQCHAGFPHAEDWAASGHILHTSVVGEGTCVTCHAAGDGPAHLSFSCAGRCHGGEEAGW